MRPLLLTLLLVASLLAAAQASTAEPLRVGITPNYEPLAFKREGVLMGVEVDLARLLAKGLERDLKLVELEWGDLIGSLERGDIDIVMSGMSITEARAQRVAFTESYLSVGQMGLVRIADVARFTRPLDVFTTSEKVGFLTGTTGAQFAQTKLPNAQLTPQASVPQGVGALRSGEIDIFIHDAPTVWRIGGAPDERELIGLYEPFTDEALAWAVRKDDETLLRRVEKAFDEIKSSGALGAVLNRWIPLQIEVQ